MAEDAATRARDGASTGAAIRVGRRPRSRSAGAIVVAVLALLIGALWGRSALAAADRAQVHLVADGNALRCEGTSVEHTPAPGSSDGQVSMPVADINAGMRCDYRFVVSNEGSRSTRIERITFSLLGPRGGAAIEAVALDPPGIAPISTEENDGTRPPVDAIFELGVDLPPDAALELRVRIVHRPDGCTAGGSTIWFRESPTATLRSLGVSGTRSAESPGFGFRGHPVLNCDEHLDDPGR